MIRVLLIDREFNPDLLSPELKQLYEIYKANLERRSAFKMLLPLKIKNKKIYIQQCQKLAKTVTYISFSASREMFVVRPTVNEKRLYLGSTSDFDDACELLAEYLKLNMTNKND